jgi:hypothetical protein
MGAAIAEIETGDLIALNESIEKCCDGGGDAENGRNATRSRQE